MYHKYLPPMVMNYVSRSTNLLGSCHLSFSFLLSTVRREGTMDSGNGKAGSSSSEVKEIDEAQVNSAYELYEEVQEKEAAVKSINIKIDGNAERKAKVETTRKQIGRS